MSDLEFRRELSPDQLNEALSLLDGGAGASIDDPQAQGARVAEATGPGAGALRPPVAAQDRLFAAEDPHHQRLNRAAIFFCGIAVAATLVLLAWDGPQLAHPASGPAPITSPPAVAGSGPDRKGETAAGSDAALSADATPAPPPASASAESRGEQSENRKPPARHARTVKPRSWQRHPQARADLDGGPCPYFGCLWQPHRVFYDPPRGPNQ